MKRFFYETYLWSYSMTNVRNRFPMRILLMILWYYQCQYKALLWVLFMILLKNKCQKGVPLCILSMILIHDQCLEKDPMWILSMILLYTNVKKRFLCGYSWWSYLVLYYQCQEKVPMPILSMILLHNHYQDKVLLWILLYDPTLWPMPGFNNCYPLMQLIYITLLLQKNRQKFRKQVISYWSIFTWIRVSPW